MGVDYVPRFGIGYKVCDKEFEDEDMTMGEYLYELLDENKEFRYLEVGEGSYTGECNEFFVVLKNPFSKGLDLTENKNTLLNFLTENEIKIDGEFGVVGGLHVY